MSSSVSVATSSVVSVVCDSVELLSDPQAVSSVAKSSVMPNQKENPITDVFFNVRTLFKRKIEN